jgi:hypothetical protein
MLWHRANRQNATGPPRSGGGGRRSRVGGEGTRLTIDDDTREA